MPNYYFVGTYIPEIKLGSPLEMKLESYTELLEEHLSIEDKKKWMKLRSGEKTEGFAERFLEEERFIQLVLVALRAKKWGRPLSAELEEEPPEHAELKTLYDNFWDEPLKLHQALLTYRFQKAGELIGLQTFTLDRLLSYYVQLVLADQWNKEI